MEILDVCGDTVTFRYEQESDVEKRIWEKTTRIDNIAEIEVRLLTLPKGDKQLQQMKSRLSKLLEQDEK